MDTKLGCIWKNCGRIVTAKGLCQVHYKRSKGGRDMDAPFQKKDPKRGCKWKGCTKKHYARSMCNSHYSQWCKGKSLTDLKWKWGVVNWAINKDGYLIRYVRDEDGKKIHQSQHRLVMESHLGRPLAGDENVHHKNGVRDDNRIENLELWTTMQPSGKRVVDMVIFAKEILKRYASVEVDVILE